MTGSLSTSAAYSAKGAFASAFSMTFIAQSPFHLCAHDCALLSPPHEYTLPRPVLLLYQSIPVNSQYGVPKEQADWGAWVFGFLFPPSAGASVVRPRYPRLSRADARSKPADAPRPRENTQSSSQKSKKGQISG